MKVKILLPRKKVVDEEAREVILPGLDGEFSVMDFHQPCLYALRPGQIKIKFRDKRPGIRVPLKRGVAKIDPFKVVALIDV